MFNKLTFAIITANSTWRADLTTRFTEYFSHKINAEDFLTNIIFPASIDDALKECTTDYLIVQSSGHIIFDLGFFTSLEVLAKQNQDIVIGHIELTQDYFLLDSSCFFVNVPLWKEAGKPKFNSGRKDGPTWEVSEFGSSKNKPGKLKIISADAKDRAFVTNSCSNSGAEILIRQLEMFGQATSLGQCTSTKHSQFLSCDSPYSEIHNETLFEKRFLAGVSSRIFCVDSDDMSNVKNVQAELVVAPAQGLKALSLAEHFGAKKIVVYDFNPLALELQRRIFASMTSVLYGDIIRKFLNDYPDANIVDDWMEDEHAVIRAPNDVEVVFALVDAFTFEMEELIRRLDPTVPAVFDISDIFIYPFNFYKRPLYQVQGLFAEIYSLIKSRTGPSHVLGFAPGFQKLDTIEINTSVAQFDQVLVAKYESRLAPPESDDIDTLEDIALEELEELPPLVFAPATTIQIPTEELPKHNTTKTRIDVNAKSPAFIASELGFEKTRRAEQISGKQVNLLIFSKIHEYPEFTAYFEYTFDEVSGNWNFKAGKVDGEKRVEFSNGIDQQSFIRHLIQPEKLNPKTALKYF